MRKKVFLFIPTIGGGGAEKMVIDLAAGIDKDRYDVTLFSLYDESRAVPERVRYAAEKGVNVRYLGKKSGFDVKLLLRIAQLIRKEKPDVLHSNLESFQYISVLGRVMHVKHVHTMHSVGGKEHRIYGYLLKNAYRNKQFYMVALSTRIHDELAEMYPELKDRLVTVFNGVDVKHFLSDKSQINDETIEFVCVANLTPVKNHEMLIRAFSLFLANGGMRAHLKLVGDGVLREELEQLVASKDLTSLITFVGTLADPAPVLKESDIFVMSSHYEGMPLSVAEAMAAGLPVVAPQIGGLNEMIDGNGILYQVDDPNELANAMLKIASNKGLWLQYHEESCKRAWKFDISNMVREYEGLYDSSFSGKTE